MLSEIIQGLDHDQISIGLNSIISSVQFLHDQQMIHGNITIASILVNSHGDWLLSNLEMLCELENYNVAYIQKYKALNTDASFIYPEDLLEFNIESFKARDYYGLGRLINVELAPFIFSDLDQPKEINGRVLRNTAILMMSDPVSMRESITNLLSCKAFSENIAIHIDSSLRHIRTMGTSAKTEFLAGLYTNLRSCSMECRRAIIIERILTPDFFSEKVAIAFFSSLFLETHLDFSEEALLSRANYFELVVPFIRGLFQIKEYAVRVGLLKLISLYIEDLNDADTHYLDTFLVENVIFGFEDQDDYVYYFSIYGLASIMPVYIQATFQLETRNEGEINVESDLLSKIPAGKRESSKLRFSSVDLVENYLIPHALKLSVTGNLSALIHHFWLIFASLTHLWKFVTRLNNSTKVTIEI